MRHAFSQRVMIRPDEVKPRSIQMLANNRPKGLARGLDRPWSSSKGGCDPLQKRGRAPDSVAHGGSSAFSDEGLAQVVQLCRANGWSMDRCHELLSRPGHGDAALAITHESQHRLGQASGMGRVYIDGVVTAGLAQAATPRRNQGGSGGMSFER